MWPIAETARWKRRAPRARFPIYAQASIKSLTAEAERRLRQVELICLLNPVNLLFSALKVNNKL